MRALRVAGFALAVLLTASCLLAQGDGPGPGGPPGGPGGGGGFGFRGGRGGFGDRNSMVGMLRQEDVRAELNITADQETKVREAGDAVRQSIQPPEFNYEELRDASEEERRAAFTKMREFGESIEKELRSKLAGILDEAQMTRLRGLWAQRVGDLAALNHEDIAVALNLTDEQKATLKTQLDEERPMMRGGGGGFGFGGRPRGEGNPPPAGAGGPPAGGPPAGGPPPGGDDGGERRDRRSEARRISSEKALAVLTEEQKTAYATIKGAAFPFAEPQFRAFGRGRDGEGPGFGPGRGNRPPAE
ncbi:MAG: hypothetical protein JNG89_01955 [Planctomycetaceae bacterium]|nr:hypothetical protein [Planctomycetaceae bacterium]